MMLLLIMIQVLAITILTAIVLGITYVAVKTYQQVRIHYTETK